MREQALGTLMSAEMAEQPQVLKRLATRYADIAGRVRSALAGTVRPAGVAFLARGSSDNAALLGRYAVELRTGVPTCLIAPSVLTAYGRTPTGFHGWVVLALSQSGRTPEIIDSAQRLRRAGATIIAITNDASSELAAAADLAVALDAGPERAIPATKTVTAQLLGILAVVAGIGDGPELVGELDQLADRAAEVLADTAPVDSVATMLARHRRLAVVARGLLYPAAKETALKLQETTGAMAHGFSTADFRHGPIAVCGPDAPAVLLAGSGPADHDTRELVAVLRERGADSIVAGSVASDPVRWPVTDGATDCLLATIRGQQLALAVCRELGIDPDHPLGLNKVTLTH